MASSVLNVVVDSPAAPAINSGVLNGAFRKNCPACASKQHGVAYEGTTQFGTAGEE